MLVEKNEVGRRTRITLGLESEEFQTARADKRPKSK